jgi:hypothetical protein
MGLHDDLTDQTTGAKKRQGEHDLQKVLRHDFVLGEGTSRYIVYHHRPAEKEC